MQWQAVVRSDAVSKDGGATWWRCKSGPQGRSIGKPRGGKASVGPDGVELVVESSCDEASLDLKG